MNSSDKKYIRSREEDMEEGQRKLDDEMEKRRRRVQEWQEKRRKKEESAGETDELKSGKTWTLEGESDDEEAAANNENEEGDMDVDDNVKQKGDIENGNGDVMVNRSPDTVAPLQNGGEKRKLIL